MLFKKFGMALLAALWFCAGIVGAAQAYTLGAGDLVRITVYDHPDLTTVGRISDTGSIAFPLIGEQVIGGLTEREAEKRIAGQLERKRIVRAPQVNLIVEQYQSQRVSVLGNVANPGVYNISPGSTIVDLIAEAGGTTDEAGDTAVLTKGAEGAGQRIEVNLRAALEGAGLAELPEVANGDRIYVPRMSRFYIYGQVNRPDAYRLDEGMTIMHGISVAGGLTDKGTERGLTIKRRNPDTEEMQTLAADIDQTIQEDDVIYVKESLF
jgi:polysaccharide export outer membrane protein